MKDLGLIHFIGIGGAGMSAIAWIARDQGAQVQGSDLRPSKYDAQLEEAGVPIIIGQGAENITDDIDLVVVSTAIRDNNPELMEAKRRGIEVWHRSRMLTAITEGYQAIAVSGTHGKTTTSSLIGTALERLGADPTFLIGGIVEDRGSNARCGKGEYFVSEADESDSSFHAFRPRVAVVTNVEPDHLDHYGTFDALMEAFGIFMGNVVEEGCAVVCNQTPGLVELARANAPRTIVYGLEGECDYRVIPGERGAFQVLAPTGEKVDMRLASNPGRHNMLNAAAALATLVDLGFGLKEAAQAICQFKGVHRRFTQVGVADGVTVIDDYGHHPTEVAATIAAAKEMGYRKVHVVFQPHRYTRTQNLREEFGCCFDGADTLTLMDVYAAGETPIPGITGKSIVDAVLEHDPRAAVAWIPHRTDTVPYLLTKVEPGDIVLMSGAGDINVLAPQLVELLQQREAGR